MIITDVQHWVRVGRGRSLQFFATDEEVQSWLCHLPEKYKPYYIVGFDRVKAERTYVDQFFRCEMSALLECMNAREPKRWNFWIQSEAITPDIERGYEGWLDLLFTRNGLVHLQHGMIRKDRRDASSVGIVDKVRNLNTGALQEHQEYLEVFYALRKLIKKALCYSAIVHFPDGSQYEDTSLRLFTDGAVRAHEDGMLFTRTPGRPLKAGR
jgi:hypothetical protein